MKVLDRGFVELAGTFGSDEEIARTARVSTGSENKGEEANKRLINYLMKNGHMSPFEFGMMKFHVKAPIFVARQWFRHRIGSYAEKSARYTEVDGDFYIPERGTADTHRDMMFWAITDAIDTYGRLLHGGVDKEIARMVLPQALYTEFYWLVNLRSLMNFLDQRLDMHAQYEIRMYAQAIADFFVNKFPMTSDAWQDLDETPTI